MAVASTVLLLIAGFSAATVGISSAAGRIARPYLTLSIVVVLALCFIAQICWPHLLADGQRSAAAIQQRQFYRLLTAQLLQDGGVVGASFNLAMLTVLGVNAERIFPRLTWVAIYIVGGSLSEVVALSWQPVGAGNSVSYMSLAGALLLVGFQRNLTPSVRWVSLLGLAAGLVLCALKDIHGAAVLIGAGICMFFAIVSNSLRGSA